MRICNVGLTALACLVVAAGAPAWGQATIHVDDDALAGGDGTTWSTAFRHLRDALSVASAGDEIRVAGGTYKPDQDEAGDATPGDRTESFALVSGVTVVGGYRGCPGAVCAGGDPDQRDIALYETVLSGDLAGDDVADLAGFFACYSGDGNIRVPECDPFDIDGDLDVDEIDGGIDDNSFHVVVASGTDAATIFDGITVTAGCANGLDAAEQNKGGGIYNEGGALTVTLCRLTLNSAEFGGGGVYNVSAAAVMSACDFVSNRILGGSPTIGGGGGLLNSGGSPTLVGCGFTGNIARFIGGGLSSDVPAGQVITGCTFTNNTADVGAGLTTTAGAHLVEDCTFIDNHALHAGGAIDVSGSDLTGRRCRFVGNIADTYGGAVFQDNNVGSTWIDCTFAGNTAGAQGGAMFMIAATPVTIVNCRFFGNVADEINVQGSSGGAIELAVVDVAITNCLFSGNLSERGGAVAAAFLSSGVYTFDSCTFAGNTALDVVGGIHAFSGGGNATLRNCVLWGNSDSGGTGVSAQLGPASPTVLHSLIQDDDPNDASIPFGGAANGNIDDAPKFIDADGPDNVPGTEDDDLRLAIGSPCIDAGDSSAVPPDVADLDGDGDTAERMPHDLNHDARFIDDPSAADSGTADPPDHPQVVDMGAFEAPGVAPIPAVSDWGAGAMVLSLLIVATFGFRRRDGASRA